MDFRGKQHRLRAIEGNGLLFESYGQQLGRKWLLFAAACGQRVPIEPYVVLGNRHHKITIFWNLCGFGSCCSGLAQCGRSADFVPMINAASQ